MKTKTDSMRGTTVQGAKFEEAYRSYVRQVIGRRSGSLSAIQVGASEGRAIVSAGLATSCLTNCVAAERS